MTMPSAYLLLVYLLAVARLTRLVAADRITEPVRAAITGWAYRRSGVDPVNGEVPMISYLVHCRWCMGLWISAAVTVAAWGHWSNPWLLAPALALALSHGVGLLAGRE